MVPRLQERGTLRTGYRGGTLRDHPEFEPKGLQPPGSRRVSGCVTRWPSMRSAVRKAPTREFQTVASRQTGDLRNSPKMRRAGVILNVAGSAQDLLTDGRAMGDSRPAGRAEAEVTLLGGFRLANGGRDIGLPMGGQRLVAILALRGRLCRSRLAGTLRPETTEQRAHASLRTGIWRVNQAAPDLVVARNGQVCLDVRARIDVADLVRRSVAAYVLSSTKPFPRLWPSTPALRRLPPRLRHFMRPTSSRVSGLLQEGGKARPAVRRRRTSPDAGRRATRGAGPAPGARPAGGGRQHPVAGTASECSQP